MLPHYCKVMVEVQVPHFISIDTLLRSNDSLLFLVRGGSSVSILSLCQNHPDSYIVSGRTYSLQSLWLPLIQQVERVACYYWEIMKASWPPLTPSKYHWEGEEIHSLHGFLLLLREWSSLLLGWDESPRSPPSFL